MVRRYTTPMADRSGRPDKPASVVAFFFLSAVMFGWLQPRAAGADCLRLFLVAENPSLIDPCTKCDSYVLPLSNAEDISRAREIIAAGGLVPDAIVVAAIVAGADGINRNHLAPGAPEWSWHVVEFFGFAEGVIEILDGWPSYVESNVEGWIANTRSASLPEDWGLVGFTNYTVVAEIPEPSSNLMVGVAGATIGILGWAQRRGRLSRVSRSNDVRAQLSYRACRPIAGCDLPDASTTTAPTPRSARA